MNQIQRRCGQLTWDGYPSQSCRRPARKTSRNCSNLKRTKRFHKLRLRDRKSSVHGFGQMGRKWRTEISPGFARLRVESRGPGFTHRCYTLGRGDEHCACVGIGTGRGNGSGGHFWSFSSCGVGETFLLSHRQLSTGNQVLCGR